MVERGLEIMSGSFLFRRKRSPPDDTSGKGTAETQGGPTNDSASMTDIMTKLACTGAVLKSGTLTKVRWKMLTSTRYFVLRDNGKFYYYRSQTAAAKIDNHRGVIVVKDANILTTGRKSFVVSTWKHEWKLRAKSGEERDAWVKSLRGVRACAQALEENEVSFIVSRHAEQKEKQFGTAKADSLAEVDKVLRELYECALSIESHSNKFRQEAAKCKETGTRTTELRESMVALAISIANFKVTSKHYFERSKLFQQELCETLQTLRSVREQRDNLLKQLEAQAKQLKVIAESAKVAGSGVVINEQAATELATLEEESLFSAIEDISTEETKSEMSEEIATCQSHESESDVDSFHESVATPSVCTPGGKKTGESDVSLKEAREEAKKLLQPAASRAVVSPVTPAAPTPKPATIKELPKPSGPRKRRTKVPPKTVGSWSLWAIIKNALGKDLSRIQVPVEFNEPLSFIQRFTENLEYAELLNAASIIADPYLQLSYVAAFVISSWSGTALRTCKPFNPLWGETFECDRTEDLGWRSIAEQVSHHPPISLIHAEGRGWTYDEEMNVKSQLQATAMRLYPEGGARVYFEKTKASFTWTRRDVMTFVKGIIIGPLTVHNEGTCKIKNEATGDICEIELARHSFFSSPKERTFKACVKDAKGSRKYSLTGDWTLRCILASSNGSNKKVVWTRKPLPLGSDKMYNFSMLAIQLNDPEFGVAPTDSRRRPDMRLLENGHLDQANAEKARLEQRQRVVMRNYQMMVETKKPVTPRPLWFRKAVDPRSGVGHYVYEGSYWQCKQTQNWAKCPDIFGKN